MARIASELIFRVPWMLYGSNVIKHWNDIIRTVPIKDTLQIRMISHLQYGCLVSEHADIFTAIWVFFSIPTEWTCCFYRHYVERTSSIMWPAGPKFSVVLFLDWFPFMAGISSVFSPDIYENKLIYTVFNCRHSKVNVMISTGIRTHFTDFLFPVYNKCTTSTPS